MNACPATRCRRAALALLGLALLPLAQAAAPPPPPRPGFLIVIGNGVDPARLRDYGIQAGKLVARHGGRLLFATQEGQTEILEGGPFPGSIRASRRHRLSHRRRPRRPRCADGLRLAGRVANRPSWPRAPAGLRPDGVAAQVEMERAGLRLLRFVHRDLVIDVVRADRRVAQRTAGTEAAAGEQPMPVDARQFAVPYACEGLG